MPARKMSDRDGRVDWYDPANTRVKEKLKRGDLIEVPDDPPPPPPQPPGPREVTEADMLAGRVALEDIRKGRVKIVGPEVEYIAGDAHRVEPRRPYKPGVRIVTNKDMLAGKVLPEDIRQRKVMIVADEDLPYYRQQEKEHKEKEEQARQ